MLCSKCGAENPSDKKFCGDCGAALANRCRKCGVENPLGKRFCGDCGTALGPSTGAAVQQSDDSPFRVAETTAAESLDGERKTITALFADIKGSMELIENLDPEQARNIIDPALKVIMEAMQRYGGHVVQSTGDGIFAVFGVPLATRTTPSERYMRRFGCKMLNRYSDRLVAEGRKPVQARVGINTGEAVVRSLKTDAAHAEYTPVGHSISLAARMEALSSIGSVAVAHQTMRLCEGYFNFKPLGAARIRGVSEAVRVYEVTGLGPLRTHFQVSAERGLSRFVGRQGEFEQLGRALELAEAGHSQVVAAVGEAGVGKSRLFHEFRTVAQSECMVLETFSLAHGEASPYLPVMELLRNYFGITLDDDNRQRREKRIAKLLAVDAGRVFSRDRGRARR
jgi:class 3 adenylate cyclase